MTVIAAEFCRDRRQVDAAGENELPNVSMPR
jgi:hypothetical protein